MVRPLLKVLLIAAAILIPTWLLYKGVYRLWFQATDLRLPESGPVAAQEFFTSLEQENYQECYHLLNSERKAATTIGKQDRIIYFDHFNRIRKYLKKYAGDDFVAAMQVSPDGATLDFPNDITLTLTFQNITNVAGKRYYTIREVNEFPIDIAPGIGLEAHNRRTSQAIESMGDLPRESDENLENPHDILDPRSRESPDQRFERLTRAFQNARQLDIRHLVLEMIIRENRNNPSLTSFLTTVARDESVPKHLRKLAQKYLY